MEEATIEIWNRPSSKLPLTKDLPRLAKLVSVYSHYEIERLYPKVTNSIEALQYLFETLAKVMESPEKAEQIRKEFPPFFEADIVAKQPLDLCVKAFMEKVIGDESESKIHRLLRFCNQSIIAPAVKKLKVEVLTIANFTKDLDWEIEIEFLSDMRIIASHIRRETCLQGNFTYAWKLSLIFDKDVTKCEEVLLSVTKLDFKVGVAEKKKEEVTRLLKPLFEPQEQLIIFAQQSSVLDLSHLGIKALARAAFSLESLEICYLHNNKIDALPASFVKLTNLKILWLSKNNFKSFPTILFQIPALKIVHLGDNSLTEVPENINELKHLHELHLENNQIKTIPISSLKTMIFLNVLNLSGNPVDTSIFETSKQINLENVVPLFKTLDAVPIGNLKKLNEASTSSEHLATPRIQIVPPNVNAISTDNAPLLSPRLGQRRLRLLNAEYRLSMSLAETQSLTPEIPATPATPATPSSPSSSSIPSIISVPSPIATAVSTPPSSPNTPIEEGAPIGKSPSASSASWLLKGCTLLDNLCYPLFGKKFTQFLVYPTDSAKKLLRCTQEIFVANEISASVTVNNGVEELWLCDKAGSIILWAFHDLTIALTSVIHAHTDAVRALLQVKENTVWSAGDDKLVKIWSTQDHKCIKEFTDESVITTLLLQGDRVYGGSASGKLLVWNLDGELLQEVNTEKPILSLCSDGGNIWMGSNDCVLSYSIANAELRGQITFQESGGVKSLLVITRQNDNEVWCLAHKDMVVLKWNDELHQIVEDRKVVCMDGLLPIGVAESPGLIWLSSAETLELLDYKTLNCLAKVTSAHTSKISKIISATDEHILTLGGNRQILLWNVIGL